MFVKLLNLNKTLHYWTQSAWEETSLIERELLERCSINLTTMLSYLSHICLLKVFFSKLAAVLWWFLASLAVYRESHQFDIYTRIWGSSLRKLTLGDSPLSRGRLGKWKRQITKLLPQIFLEAKLLWSKTGFYGCILNMHREIPIILPQRPKYYTKNCETTSHASKESKYNFPK